MNKRLHIPFSVCMCACICAHESVLVCVVGKCVHKCGGQRAAVSVAPQVPPTLFLETGLSDSPEQAKYARLACQQALGAPPLPSLPSQAWYHKHALTGLAFSVGSEDSELRSSCVSTARILLHKLAPRLAFFTFIFDLTN